MWIQSMFSKDSESRGDEDHSRSGSALISRYEWCGPIWPIAQEYIVYEYEDRTLNKYGLKACIDGSHVDVMAYDDGGDEYGKFRAGKWRPISDICSWQPNELRDLCEAIAGRSERIK